MSTKKKDKPKGTYINNDLPVLFVDYLDTRHREDGMNYLNFKTNTPDIIVEQVRLMTNDESLRGMIDDLCLTANYFPKKPRKPRSASPNK